MKLKKYISRCSVGFLSLAILSVNINSALAIGGTFGIEQSLSDRSGLSLKQRIVTHQIDYISRIIREHNQTLSSANNLARVIVRESNELGLDPLLITAIIKAESTFKPYARSKHGASGLMQLLPSTGKYISKMMNINWQGYRLNDVEYNVRLGLNYYKYLMSMFNGNLRYSLIAYNWGPNNTLRALNGEAYVPSTSNNYVNKISRNRDKWQDQYSEEFSKLFT